MLLVPALWLAGSATRAQKPCGVPEGSGPRIEAATPVVVRSEGATVCACGAFSDPAALEGLRIDGRPVEASVDAFGRVATLRLPPALAPGSHTLTGSPEAGFGPEDRAELRLIQINTKTCEPLPFGPRRRVHVMIAGTEDPVQLRVRNETPALVTLAGGSAFELTTSGGRRNQAIINAKVTGLAGRWLPTVELASPPCPCAGGAERGIPPERVAELEACLQAAVAEIEAWFDGRARELAARAERGVLAPREVLALIDGLERRFLRVLATPDLAALRAWVEDELDREREVWSGKSDPGGRTSQHRATTETLTLASDRAWSRGPKTGFAQASLVVARTQGFTLDSLSAFVDRIKSFFDHLDTVSSDLIVDLCVRSVQDRAKVFVHPAGFKSGSEGPEYTDTLLKGLTRGLYVGRIEHDGREVQLEDLDLVRKADCFIDCDLSDPPCPAHPQPRGFQCIPNGSP
ncbi:MAG TPA: hypothetical protein VJG13_04480 [Thermoanaerobaculia bacterium]|nr:hypothetical protein [Thermoanaerobaculia bacterium]